ncbi:MAG: 4a-hydroxytetrahydrobiopterin dehydratase [Anaerolineales bacterium]|nr:MAG: 4a-hydroxytetrahydrobiopterin dehydratase [Anaerolineales bacterium]
MSELAQRELTPPRGKAIPALKGEPLSVLYDLLGEEWELVEDHHLTKTYRFKNFQEALNFTNRVGALAESVDHHPEICLTWGRATLTIWTHSVGGLSDADFVFAARADTLVE